MSVTPATAVVCPNCGAATVPGDRFCEACGADLPYTGPAPQAVADDDAEPLTGPVTAPAVGRAPAARPCPFCGADAGQIVDGYCGVCGMKQPAARDHVELADEGIAAVSDRGRRHHRNEDAFAVARLADGRVVAVVCDGVSTTVNPDLASAAAAEAALSALSTADITAAAAAAQAAVEGVEGAAQPPDLGWPSCTFLAGVVGADGHVELGTMGDCRTFWLPGEGPAQVLTEDDSWAADQVESGAMTAEEAYASPQAHTITRWLGQDADRSWRPRLAAFDPPGPGRLLLCSDGLWNYAETAEEVAAAAGAGPLLEVAQRLVAFANDAGGHDNITVVLVDVAGPPSADPAPADPPADPEPNEPDPDPSKGPST